MECSIVNANIVKGPWPTSLDKCLMIFTAFLSQAKYEWCQLKGSCRVVNK